MKFTFLILLLIQFYICDSFEEDEIQNICSRCQSNFNETYKDEELINKTKDDDKINEYVIKLVESLKNDSKNSSDLVNDYVIPRFIYPNIAYIILLLLGIILWIILIIFLCRTKKKFFSENNSTKSRKIVYLNAVIFIVIIIISSLSLSYIIKSHNFFNSSICALLRIYIDIRDGDQAHTTHWEGIKKLQEDLTGDKNNVNKLINTINLQENITYILKNNKYEKKTFDEDEKNNNYYSDSEVSSPNSLNKNVFPTFSKNRKIDLNKILFEYNLKLKQGIEINDKISVLNEPIKDNPELITKEYLVVNKKLSDILDTIQKSAEEYLQILIDYSKDINYIIFPLIYSIYILLIIFSIAGIIFTLLYVHDLNISEKTKKIYYKILHTLWNILFFLLISAIFSQILFKVFELFGIDGSGILQYATSEENFNSTDSIIFKGAGNAFLKVCFRDDKGDLLSEIIKTMDHGSSKIEEFDRIYIEEIIYSKYYEDIKNINMNETLNIINDLENKYNDYSLISYYEDSLLTIEKTCQYDFDELNKYTDYSNPLISYQSTILSNNHTYDVWTSKYSNCNNYKNYKYIKDKNERKEGNKYCMIIGEFDSNIAKNFYLNIIAKNTILKKIDVIFDEYYQSLQKFENDNKYLLNNEPNFILRTKNYYNDLILIKNNILKGIEYSQQIVELLNKLLGNPGIDVGIDLFTIMNCVFLKRDAKVFYIEMDKLTKNSSKLLIINIFEIIIILPSIIFVLIIIYKYKNDDNDNIGEISTDSMLRTM